MNAKISPGYAVLSCMLALAVVSVPASYAQSDIAALKAQHKALGDQLKRELERLKDYLNLVDQMLGVQLMLGQITPQQAGEQLQRITASIYEHSYTDDAKWQLHQQQFAAVDGFVRYVQSQVAAAARWPSDRPAREYRAAAEKEISELWTVFPKQQLMAVNLAPRLARIAELLAWTRGEASLPRERNPFAQSGQRVSEALSDLHQRNIVALRPQRSTASQSTLPTSGLIGAPPSPPAGGTESHAGTAEFGRTIQAAVAAAQEGRFAEALPIFEAAARANPSSDTALSGLGLCQNMLGDLDGALRTFEALYRFAPQSAGVRAWFAELLTAKGDYAGARRWIEQELAANPNSPWAWSWLGSIEWGLGQQQPARQAFARATELDPNIASRRFENGAKLAAAQPGRAIVDFTAALVLDPNGSGVYYYLGECYHRLGQRERAAQSYRLFLQADSTSEWAARARQRLEELAR